MSLRFVPSANKAAGAVCSLLSSEPFAHVQSAARCLGVELTADGPAELARSRLRLKVRGRSITSGVKPTGNWEIVNLGFLLIKSA